MSITILPQSDTAWGNIAKSTGEGIGKGLEALANMKMQEYQNKQLIKQQNEQQAYQTQLLEKHARASGIPEFLIPLAGHPELFKAGLNAAAMGWNPQAQQQQGGIAQTMGALNPQQQQYQGPESYLGLGNQQQLPSLGAMLGQKNANPQPAAKIGAPQAPGAPGQQTNDFLQATRNARMNTPEIAAANERQKSHEQFQSKEHEKERQFKTEQSEKDAQHQEDSQIRADNIKFVEQQKPIYEANQEITGKIKKARAILQKYGDKFPTGIAKYSQGEFQKMLIQNPYVHEFMNLMNDIVWLNVNAVKGQPRQWEKDIIASIKAAVDQPPETMRMRLDEMEQRTNLISQRLAYQSSISRANKKGRPRSYAQALSDFDAVQTNPLATPEPYQVGTILPAKYSPNGKRNKIVMKDGEKQFEELP